MLSSNKKALLIYPNQLFEEIVFSSEKKMVFIVEEPLLFTQYTFHKQKLVLHRGSMKAYSDRLIENGHTVHYIEISNIKETSDITKHLKKEGVSHVDFFDVVDDWLERRLVTALGTAGITHNILETPLFLTDRETFRKYFDNQNGARKYFMKTFYEWQRKRLNILIDENGKPVGGSWSFDSENRKKIPKGLLLPQYPKENANPYVTEAIEYIEKNFAKNYGSVDNFFYPVTHNEAKIWLKDFLTEKLSDFGPYEDAMTTQNGLLFHSILSPLLNIGLLSPEYVVSQTLIFYKKNNTPIASVEGFLRQIIGWREYMRAIYILEGSNIRTKNYFNAKRKIPSSFWDASTGIEPIDHTIKGALCTAYSHHIERLMVVGNFMNLCGFEPNQVHKWFMEMYIDAYDWVMVPNVYSMALYADGGIITTKPYISGSNYVLKMSDYKKGVWSDTWDALFWSFVGKHYEKLQKEGRLGFIGVLYGKMSQDKRDAYENIATEYLKNNY